MWMRDGNGDVWIRGEVSERRSAGRSRSGNKEEEGNCDKWIRLAQKRRAPAGTKLRVIGTPPDATVDAVVHELRHLDAALQSG
ncbi:hypothetical protein E2C01_021518 [Portunus trituberculatus]|uniref:Uncharacterized protein n=1 Tax=Portunus trituberculatus TaxID=210409 RepID=A0A5B7E4P0_PORTR|nr:hypothetical protein [Portunus trituberculatus]